MMEPLILWPLWIWDCLGAFSFQLQYANPYPENIQKAPIYFSPSPLLRCLHREAIKWQFHGRRLHAHYSKTKQAHRRCIEAAGGTTADTRVRGGTCVPARVNKQHQGIVLWLSGHTACSRRSHRAHGSGGGCRGRQQEDCCGSPKRHHFSTWKTQDWLL